MSRAERSERLILRFFGHACFGALLPTGESLLIDPFRHGGLGGRITAATPPSAFDYVLSTHDHVDHSAVDVAPGARPIATPFQGDGWTVEATVASHDEFGGRLRGGTTRVFRLIAGSCCVVHLGDIGERPTGALLEWLAAVPITALVVPVGGYFTLGPDGAAELTHLLAPRWVIPCHDATTGVELDELGDPALFLRRFQPAHELPQLELSCGQRPHPARRVDTQPVRLAIASQAFSAARTASEPAALAAQTPSAGDGGETKPPTSDPADGRGAMVAGSDRVLPRRGRGLDTVVSEDADGPRGPEGRSVFVPSPKRRARWWRSISTALDAGLSFDEALRPLAGASTESARHLGAIRDAVREGNTIDQALARSPLCSRTDVAIVRAHAESGGLPEGFELIASRAAEEARRRAAIARRAAYPTLVLLAAAVFPTAPLLVTAGLGAWLATALPIVLIVAAAWLAFAIAGRLSPASPLRHHARETVAANIPIVRGVHRAHAAYDFVSALRALHGAGVPLSTAWEIAAGTHDDAVFRSTREFAGEIRAGTAGWEAIAERIPYVEPDEKAEIANAARAGTLDKHLDWLERARREAAETATRRAMTILFGIVIAIAVSVAAFRTVQSLLDSFGALDSTLDQLQGETHRPLRP